MGKSTTEPHQLDPIDFPLMGSRLIEASAGTGKTYTIAALYVRLVLGHGKSMRSTGSMEGATAFHRPLLPSEILVMTFTKAATQELSSRIQSRLMEIAEVFRAPERAGEGDQFVRLLLLDYPEESSRLQAAWQLHQAALCMDEASVFTIDAWCQKVLREHAVHTGQPFDEELVANEDDLRRRAVQDFWRKNVYKMDLDLATHFKRLFRGEVFELTSLIQAYLKNQKASHATHLSNWPNADASQDDRLDFVSQFQGDCREHLSGLSTQKHRLNELALVVSDWIEQQWSTSRDQWNGVKLGQHHLKKWLQGLQSWCKEDSNDHFPPNLKDRWSRFSGDGFLLARRDTAPSIVLPPFIDEFHQLGLELIQAKTLFDKTWPFITSCVSQEIEALKLQNGQFGFADLLIRLDRALKSEHGHFLKSQLREQFPIIMVDEFQDTSPIQFSIFNEIYSVEQNQPESGIFLIGDPKQSIYSFRGADIHSYLLAKDATEPRHYVLGRNFRSTHALVNAVNHVFECAEQNRSAGAFSYRSGAADPLPFLPVQAQGLKEQLFSGNSPMPAITTAYALEVSNAKEVRRSFANCCAEQLVAWLNDERVCFKSRDLSGSLESQVRRLKPADIAILVRTGAEAQLVRYALSQRGVASVYLSDKDSVLKSDEARDLAYWMRAVLSPMDALKVKTALALPMLYLTELELQALSEEGHLFDRYSSSIQELSVVWHEHGILAMIRKTLALFNLPAKWLAHSEGQRKLTNILQLSEILQSQSVKVHAQKGLLDWLIHAMTEDSSDGEEHILRLESDAQLVKIVTIHKSKGLEFNVVMLPFATTFNSKVKSEDSTEEAEPSPTDEHSPSAAKAPWMEESSRENIRLLYVALTRAKHALWLGFSRMSPKPKSACLTHLSALGTLMTNAEPPWDELQWMTLLERFLGQEEMCLVESSALSQSFNWMKRRADESSIQEPLAFKGRIDRDYKFSSFSSLLRTDSQGADPWSLDLSTPAEDEPMVLAFEESSVGVSLDGSSAAFKSSLTLSNRLQSAHSCLAFSGGIDVGNFVHEILRWSLFEGRGYLKTSAFHTRLMDRIETLLPQKLRQQEALISNSRELTTEYFSPSESFWLNKSSMCKLVFKWIGQILYSPLEQLGVSLSDLEGRLTEAEFWMTCERFKPEQFEAIVAQMFLPGRARKTVRASHWHGMLMGFADVMFECKGKYYVLDYKTNTLGLELKDYELAALQRDVLENRYDLQAAIYLLALHRLLKSRLSNAYDPEVHLGGAYVWYVRGLSAKGQGLCLIKPPSKLILDLESALAGQWPNPSSLVFPSSRMDSHGEAAQEGHFGLNQAGDHA